MWNPVQEGKSPERLRAEQSASLVRQVKNLYSQVAFYREKMDACGTRPKAIKSISDIADLPLITKQDLRDAYPFGMLAATREEVVEIHTSSGTTGKPVVGAYTRNDIALWSETMARTLAMGGITSRDTIQNMFGYGMFTGGLGVHYGAASIGATVLPASSGNSKRQIQMLQDFGADAITCTPSYCLYLAEFAEELNVDIRDLGLKAGFFGAEPWSENMRQDIQSKFGLKAYDIYGLTEIIGPGVAAECECQNGLHFFEDHFYPEIIDPATCAPVPDGESGELVISTLTREGTPILRYRTRDITCIIPEPCSCGRTLRRIRRLLGRNDDMLIIRGVNVFPSQIEEVLFNVEGVEPHYQIVVERKGQLDSLEVQVEVNDAIFSDEIRRLEQIEHRIRDEIRSMLGLQVQVRLVEPKSIARSEGKAKRVVDKRNLQENRS